MNYYYNLETVILKNPLRKGIRLYFSDRKSIALSDEKQKYASITEIIAACRQTPPERIEAWNPEENDMALLFREFGASILQLNLCLNSNALDSLEYLTALNQLDLHCTGKTIRLWNISRNAALEKLTLELPECRAIDNVAGLKDATIKHLKLFASGVSLPKPVRAPLFSTAHLASMPQLQIVELYTEPPTDPIKALGELSALTWLKELHLHDCAFTAAQFAWLFSRLPATKDFCGIANFYPDRSNDTTMMILYGSDKPDRPISDEAAVHIEYKALCERYAAIPAPPQN